MSVFISTVDQYHYIHIEGQELARFRERHLALLLLHVLVDRGYIDSYEIESGTVD